jgi:hypothetical protein
MKQSESVVHTKPTLVSAIVTNSKEGNPSWEAQIINFPSLIKPQDSVSSSQELASGPYPETDEPNPQAQILFP